MATKEFPQTHELTIVVPEGIDEARIYNMLAQHFRAAWHRVQDELRREVASAREMPTLRTDIIRMKVSEIEAYRQLETWSDQRELSVYKARKVIS